MTTEPITATQIQPQITKQLWSLQTAERLAGALLFVGAKGVGKWLVARELAKVITCAEDPDGFCGRCDSCRQADAYSHPDILYLFPLPKEKYEPHYYPYLETKADNPFAAGSTDVTSFITIDSIRRFAGKLSRKPALSRNKVGIIYEAERMLPAAMDALLKTLEEPPGNCHLIVITDQPRFLPQTIHSRLMRVNFRPLADSFVSDYLKTHYQVDESELGILTRFAGGSLNNLDLLTEGDYLQFRKTAFGLFASALKLSSDELVIKCAGSTVLDSREKVERLIFLWQGFVRDLAFLGSVTDDLTEEMIGSGLVNFDMLGNYRDCLARTGSFERLYRGNEKLEQTRSELRRNVSPRQAAVDYLLAVAGSE